MKKLLMAAVALAALNAAPAMAESFTVQGTVNAACSAITTSVIDFGTIGISSTTGRLITNQSADTGAGTSVWCNGVNSTLSFSGNTITTTNTTSDTAFTSTLGFTPKVTLGGNNVTTGSTIGAVAATLVVKAENLTDNSKLPVAGNYTGTITVTLTPAV